MSERNKPRWRSDEAPEVPEPANDDEQLDEALDETFPASDPPAPAHPDITGWDVEEDQARGDKRRDKR